MTIRFIYVAVIILSICATRCWSNAIASHKQIQYSQQDHPVINQPPLASCIVNLCGQQPCYFDIHWIHHDGGRDVYVTRYRTSITPTEKAQVFETQYGMGDQADFIDAPLDLPFNPGQWPRLHFIKNPDVARYTVINHSND